MIKQITSLAGRIFTPDAFVVRVVLGASCPHTGSHLDEPKRVTKLHPPMSTAAPASLPLLLLLVVAPFGAVDVVWFHVHKFRLYDQPSARCETITHLLRGLLFALGALVLARYHA